MTEYCVLRYNPIDSTWRYKIAGLGTVTSFTIGDAQANGQALAARTLGVQSESIEFVLAVPISELARADHREAAHLLAVALDGIGRVLADDKPCDTMRRYGRFGWLRDGTPIVYL